MPSKRTKPVRLPNGLFITRTWLEATPQEITEDPDGIWYAGSGKDRTPMRMQDMDQRHLVAAMNIVKQRELGTARAFGLDATEAHKMAMRNKAYSRLHQELRNRINGPQQQPEPKLLQRVKRHIQLPPES